MKFQFGIDRGGTFTDIFARCPDGKIVVRKLLSVDASYEDAPREGIRRIIQEETGVQIPKSSKIDGSQIEWIRMGTTVATNALLERKGENMALLITKGFQDLLQIGNQARVDLFDLSVPMPEMLYKKVIEVDERLLTHREDVSTDDKIIASTNTGKILIEKSVDLESLQIELKGLLDEGIHSLAVCFLHSYKYNVHEKIVGKLAKDMGFKHVSLSSEVMPMIRAVPRGLTTAADAYLTPLIHNYVKTFSSGFENLRESTVLFMKSDGGLTPMADFCGSRAILSGPAGGVVGYARTSYTGKQPVIGFDMGGTSTDVSRFDGHYDHTYESTTAGITIQAPQLEISTVAAGGGSILCFRSGIFCVGPHSAGALPGPISYKKGGQQPTVTDANLVLGRLIPEFFPKIFGPNDNEMIDKDGAFKHLATMAHEINTFMKLNMTAEQVAMGFIEVANEAMCRVIRNITQGKGHDTSTHILSCFGGAGGQHACAVARNLGINKVIVPRYAGILSAYGLALADIVHEEQEPCGLKYSPENILYIKDRFDVLKQKCTDKLKGNVDFEEYLHLRYEGTDCALMCLSLDGDFIDVFTQRYEKEFGFVIKNRSVIVDDVRVRGILKSDVVVDKDNPEVKSPTPVTTVQVYYANGYQATNVYKLENLANCVVSGPSIIMDALSTILIEPNCTAEINGKGDIFISILDCSVRSIGIELDTIQLSIFSHRFMSIAEQMGRVLKRTAISTNIKERLDFSCAIFGPDGGLVSNAPHIPVHLGAMQEAVQYQLRAIGSELREGDVILSNHPCAGGSHLPDLTVITPVFESNGTRPIFFVASRGHHADIGGITPGSMPPHSKSLQEEGAIFKSFKLVKSGEFLEKELIEALNEPGKYPGSSGTRNLKDNLSDLRAQVAANRKGITLIHSLIASYGLNVVQAYMTHIQENAELAVREMLKQFSKKLNSRNLHAEDFMDDGTKIALSVAIDIEGGATFDFTGTGYEVYGNTNAPKAITISAIIYCLRCLVGEDIPLNQGCLKPIKTIIPEKCVLNPSEDSAVVGGNVLTSQRVVDVILKAFQACAASQGCMNNVTFGDESIGYYETVAGGAGAGPSWHGTSGVHTHMTNTRITDPEILETRYPVILRHFSLEKNTGGKGRYNGGNGVRREIEFRKNLKLSILTERRVFQPYGICGGLGGAVGENLLERNGFRRFLGGKCFLDCEKGDKLILKTPGGGGYGIPNYHI